MSTPTLIKLFVAIVVFLSIALLVSGYLMGIFTPRHGTENSAGTTKVSVLLRDNPSYAEADAYFKAGNYPAAKASYEKALSAAANRIQEGNIRSRIALTTDKLGDATTAIALYKEIASTVDYAAVTRAYAVQTIALMLNRPAASTLRPLIFSGMPYAAMNSSDPVLGKRQLFDYAASIYPLATSELISAAWYESRLMAVKKGNAPISAASTTAAYLSLVRQKLALADTDIARIKDDVNEKVGMPEALKRRAIVVGNLAFLGQADSTEADTAYMDAINVAVPLGGEAEGYVRYYYAAYLDSMGQSRIDDLKKVLAPFYTTTDYTGTAVEQFFQGEKNNTLSQKSVLQSLAKKDGAFKKVLVSLGWKTTDF
jgi:tetratricopeptide (TPR) repeat protein